MTWKILKTNSSSNYLWWDFDRILLFTSSFRNGAAIPTSELSTSGGLIDSFIMLIGGVNPFVIIIGIMFMYTLVANLVSWALGVNYVAMYAAKNKDLPAVFGKQIRKMICQRVLVY